MPSYALSYNCYNYVYVLAAIKEGDLFYAFDIILRLKRMHFLVRQINSKEEKKIKLNFF